MLHIKTNLVIFKNIKKCFQKHFFLKINIINKKKLFIIHLINLNIENKSKIKKYTLKQLQYQHQKEIEVEIYLYSMYTKTIKEQLIL